MYPDDFRKHLMKDPGQRPSQMLLILMAIGIAVAVTFLGGLFLYLSEIWKARPLG